MPMIVFTTNVPDAKVPEDFEIKLTDLLAESMGKPRNRILIQVHAGARMVHGAQPGPAAHLTIRSIGCVGEQLNIQHTQRVTDFIHETLGVPKDKTILEIYDLSPHQVGFNGTTVADALSKK